jgi:hypothetical protein
MTVTKLNYMKVKLAPELFVKIPIKKFKNIPENVYSLHFRAQTDRQTDRGWKSVLLRKSPKTISLASVHNSQRL